MLSREQTIRHFFEDKLKKVNEEDVLLEWDQAVNQLENIPSDLLSAYKLNIFSDEWCYSAMKTHRWKEKILNVVIRLKNLQKYFD